MTAPHKSDLPILLLGSLNAIRSMARFQKLAFLSDKETFKNTKKYSDWRAHYFGPFSADLKKDVDEYVREGLINVTFVRHPTSGELVSSRRLTPSGISKFNSIFEANREEISEIRKHLSRYQLHHTNARLLGYVYKHYKDYTKNSVIRGQHAK